MFIVFQSIKPPVIFPGDHVLVGEELEIQKREGQAAT